MTAIIILCGGCSHKEPARQLIKERCSACHTTKRIFTGSHAGEWESIVDRMIRHGATLSKDERRMVIDYLQSGAS